MAFVILHHFGAETDMCRNRKLPKTTPVNLYPSIAPTLHSRKAPGWRPVTRLCDPSWWFPVRLDKSPFVGVEDGSRQIEISGLGDTIDTVDASEIRQTHQLRLVVEHPII